MSRTDRRQLCVLALMICTLLLPGCGRQDSSPDPSMDRLQPAPEGGQEASVSALPDFHNYVVGEIPHPGRSNRNPFDDAGSRIFESPKSPTDGTSKPVQQIQLRGIVTSNNHLVAIFSTGTAGYGDQVAGWTIVDIDSKSVLLKKGRQLKELTL